MNVVELSGGDREFYLVREPDGTPWMVHEVKNKQAKFYFPQTRFVGPSLWAVPVPNIQTSFARFSISGRKASMRAPDSKENICQLSPVYSAFCRTEIPLRRFTNFSANEHPRSMEISGEEKSESRAGRIYRFSNTVDRTFLRIPWTFDLYHTRRGSQSSRISRRVFNLAVQPAPET